jgi:hypothetical protein
VAGTAAKPLPLNMGVSRQSHGITMTQETETWIVGAEYDEALFEQLRSALQTLGYRMEDAMWSLGGSQELRAWEFVGPEGILHAEAETYIGLSITGPSQLVAAVRQGLPGASQ